jgi:hypothetical protein
MEKLNHNRHWTADSPRNFTHRIASDFLAQVEIKLEKEDINRNELANRLHRTPGRVSQLFSADSMSLGTAVRLARAVDMKVALVAYEDANPQSGGGPVNSEIFHECWKQLGSPGNFFELNSVIRLEHGFACQAMASTMEATDDIPVTPLKLTRTAVTHASNC